MKKRGILVNCLIELFPGVYENYVTYEGKSKVVFVEMLMALYGMLVSTVLFYKKFQKDIEAIGFQINPYNICVTNGKIDEGQHTVAYHDYNVKSSHMNKRVNDNLSEWVEKTYRSKENGHLKVTRGKKHDYLTMPLYYSEKQKLKVDTRD